MNVDDYCRKEQAGTETTHYTPLRNQELKDKTCTPTDYPIQLITTTIVFIWKMASYSSGPETDPEDLERQDEESGIYELYLSITFLLRQLRKII